MKKIKKVTSLLSLALTTAFIFFPSHLFAATDNPTPPLQNTLKNPINVGDLTSFVKAILDIVLTIGVPVVALAIIYSGFLFVQARGNSEGLKKAKDTLVYTLIGAAILLGAWILAQAIGDTVGQLRSQV